MKVCKCNVLTYQSAAITVCNSDALGLCSARSQATCNVRDSYLPYTVRELQWSCRSLAPADAQAAQPVVRAVDIQSACIPRFNLHLMCILYLISLFSYLVLLVSSLKNRLSLRLLGC